MCDHIDHIRFGPTEEDWAKFESKRSRVIDELVKSIFEGKEETMNTRCKVRVESVKLMGSDGKGNHTLEEVQMRAVQGDKVSKGYPDDGSDEDNTYAKYSPSADFRLSVANTALFGHFKPEQKYYIDMTPAE